MRTVSIGVSVRYIECELAPKEKAPELRIELDGHFERAPVVFELDPRAPDKVYRARIEGRISSARASVPPTACLVFDSFAWRNNESDNPCLLDTGTNHVMLGELVDAFARDQKSVVKELPLIMHTANNLEKGKLELTVHAHEFELNGLALEPIRVNAALVGQNMTQYIQTQMSVEQAMPDAIKGCTRIRAPYYYGEAGLELTNGVPLPVVAYAISETPRTNTLFWENAFEVVMDRDGMLPVDWHGMNLRGKARIAAQMVCLVPQYLDYVGDTVAKPDGSEEGYENFGNALVTWSGKKRVSYHTDGISFFLRGLRGRGLGHSALPECARGAHTGQVEQALYAAGRGQGDSLAVFAAAVAGRGEWRAGGGRECP